LDGLAAGKRNLIMPLACDPSQTYKVSLDSDLEKNPKPAFLFRYLARRAYLAFEAQYHQTFKKADLVDAPPNPDPHHRSGKVFEMLGQIMTGWEHILVDGQVTVFSPDRLEDVLTIREGFELLDKAYAGQVLSLEDKKKLDSPSLCDTDNSAEPAADSPNAPTNPLQT
jgi:hypothetical protein